MKHPKNGFKNRGIGSKRSKGDQVHFLRLQHALVSLASRMLAKDLGLEFNFHFDILPSRRTLPVPGTMLAVVRHATHLELTRDVDYMPKA